ncbi:hypothetical protein ACINKY_18205 [Paenibacillus illinoisensis]|uniref:Uncharacterized protein n=1 Tax=Paenibacillus illinoisensis TaxID=59845 RepID=A0ABW8HWT4_9BACL
MNKNADQRASAESSIDANMNAILSQYAFSEQSSAQELIEFTLKSLRDLIPTCWLQICKIPQSTRDENTGIVDILLSSG